ncbi:arylsulfatase [Joostella sp.]|uniref:arylsulfatase n=1 Tax=Joostella sp. TaxID=2231138 RepID=UPI003A95AB69
MNISYNMVLISCLLSILFSCKEETANVEPVQKKAPNIVFIIADDMGVGDLGCYGQEYIKTPNIDRLASQGIKFTNFYAGSTVCAPSRASLMTGQNTGIGHIRGNGEIPLREEDFVISQLLKEQGYTTAMFGKWGLGVAGTPGSPEKKGWDYFTGHLHHVEAHFQKPDSLWTLKDKKPIKIKTPDGSFGNEIFTDKAVSFIKDQPEDKPFFLYLSFTLPHAELVAPQKYIDMYLDGDGNSVFAPEKAWPAGRHYGEQKYPKAAYAAMVSSIDDYVGKVVKVLKEKGYDENTLVVFTSDNGTHIEGGRTIKDVNFFKSSGVHRGVKRDLYEGGIKEPFIVSWPGTIKENQTSDHVAAFWDVLPTFASLAGSDKKIDTNGISFEDELLGKESQQSHDYLYWEFYEGGGKQAILKDNWKAIRLKVKKDRNAPLELYNLKDDPSESNNIALENPLIVKELDSLMKVSHTPNPVFSF